MSQKTEILAYMKAGNKITPIDALNIFGCFRLGARIADLKAEGHNIESRLVYDLDGKHYAEYALKKEN